MVVISEMVYINGEDVIKEACDFIDWFWAQSHLPVNQVANRISLLTQAVREYRELQTKGIKNEDDLRSALGLNRNIGLLEKERL